MAQGLVKKARTSSSKPAVAKRNNKKLTTKAAKALKPKKRSAVQQAAIVKKHTASLTSATEKLVSSKVGHLEVLNGTRRELENEKKLKHALHIDDEESDFSRVRVLTRSLPGYVRILTAVGQDESMSRLSKAISAVAAKSVAPPAHREFLNRLVRVDQAGELAADYIYWGQHLVFSRTKPELAPLIKHMWNQEIHHHNTFDSLQVDGRVRPSLLTPVWKVAAFTLGAATALRGHEAAMACTEAVETVIGGHYNSQLRYLHENFANTEEAEALKKLVSEFRDDELEHLETAVQHDAHEARPYWLLTETIKQGCKAAIVIAERL